MRKQWLCVLLSCLILTGCAKGHEERTTQLMNRLETTALYEEFGQVNIHKELYSYYLP